MSDSLADFVRDHPTGSAKHDALLVHLIYLGSVAGELILASMSGASDLNDRAFGILRAFRDLGTQSMRATAEKWPHDRMVEEYQRLVGEAQKLLVGVEVPCEIAGPAHPHHPDGTVLATRPARKVT